MFKCQGIFRKLPEKQEYGDKKEKKITEWVFLFFSLSFVMHIILNFVLKMDLKKKLPKRLRHEMKGKKPQPLAG